MNEAHPKLTLSQRKRLAILDAARAEFLEAGFRDTSMDRVAERAAVSKRTVYNHFPSKEDLFKAIALQFVAELQQAVTVEYDAGRTLDEQLLEIARREAEQVSGEDYVAIFRVFLSEAAQFQAMIDDIVAESSSGHDPIQAWIEAATADGRLAIQDPALASQQFISLIKGALFWPRVAGYAEPLSPAQQRAVVEGAVRLFLNTYRA